MAVSTHELYLPTCNSTPPCHPPQILLISENLSMLKAIFNLKLIILICCETNNQFLFGLVRLIHPRVRAGFASAVRFVYYVNFSNYGYG